MGALGGCDSCDFVSSHDNIGLMSLLGTEGMFGPTSFLVVEWLALSLRFWELANSIEFIPILGAVSLVIVTANLGVAKFFASRLILVL